MRFIFSNCYNELTTNKAIIDKMIYSAGDKINLLSQDLKEMVSDYDEMYKKLKTRVVADESRVVYNGNATSDWYEGHYGNKVQGLIALREYSRMIISSIRKAVTEKK